jgi:CheY-like chemotaxis protein
MPKVMVIDDSALMRKVSRDHLEEADFEVEEYLPNSVAELSERLKQSQPDLVLSDYNMPKVDGQNVARTVRRCCPEIPVIILTSNRDVVRESMLQTMGVRKILHKPISSEELIEAVREVLALS